MTPLMNGAPRLALGTAQFGFDYGITNALGRVPDDQVAAILKAAAGRGITMLDTAPAYGSSEAVLGRTLPPDAPFRIATKTAIAKGLGSNEAASHLEAGFRQSLRDLNQPSVDALLVHSVEDLLGSAGPTIWNTLCAQRDLGLVRKLGVSVYTGDEIDAVLDRYPIDVIQVPFNALDQRLATSGHLRKLADRGVEIHARSLFLQGLLVCRGTLPALCPPEVRDHLLRLWAAWREAGLSPLEGALAAGMQRPELSFLVVGVTGMNDVMEITAAYEHVLSCPHPVSDTCHDFSDHWIVDPRRWPAEAQDDAP